MRTGRREVTGEKGWEREEAPVGGRGEAIGAGLREGTQGRGKKDRSEELARETEEALVGGREEGRSNGWRDRTGMQHGSEGCVC